MYPSLIPWLIDEVTIKRWTSTNQFGTHKYAEAETLQCYAATESKTVRVLTGDIPTGIEYVSKTQLYCADATLTIKDQVKMGNRYVPIKDIQQLKDSNGCVLTVVYL